MKLFNNRAIIAVLMITIMSIIVAACNIESIRREQTEASQPPETTTKETTKPETTAPAPTTADGIVLPAEFPLVDSSTARIPITEALYELFVTNYGIEGPAPICSKTHQALLNLADGTVDFVFAILPTDEEIAYFDEKNVDVEARLYGCDGLIFIGNSANPVKDLTPDQIKAIYRGEITNWKDLGGDDAPIKAYYRDSQSGSQRFFESLVWVGETIPDFSGLTKEITESDDMGEITTNVIFDKYAIGFNIMSYVDMSFDSSDLMLFSVNGVSPSTETLADSSYEYVTEAYVLIRADAPEDSPERWLFNWFGCDESRELLQNNSELSLVFSEPYLIRLSEGNSELTEMPD